MVLKPDLLETLFIVPVQVRVEAGILDRERGVGRERVPQHRDSIEIERALLVLLFLVRKVIALFIK